MDKLYNDEPSILFHFMAVAAGKMCADADAETMDVSAEMTFNEARYKTEVHVKMTPVNQ